MLNDHHEQKQHNSQPDLENESLSQHNLSEEDDDDNNFEVFPDEELDDPDPDGKIATLMQKRFLEETSMMGTRKRLRRNSRLSAGYPFMY